MNFKIVNESNIENEDICCSLSSKKGEIGISSKKNWLNDRFKDGLVFLKLDERGKVFMEYIPSEKAFAPVEADNYMYINCFWVSGKFKGHGLASELLDRCIKDSKEKGKDGLVVLSSEKKKPFLSDPKFLKYKGFEVCDTAYPYYELLYLPFNKNSKPKFKSQAKTGMLEKEENVLYYTNQCPHTEKYANLVKNVADDLNIDLKLINIKSQSEALSSPCPFTTYSLYLKGKFITNEILTEKKFKEKLVELGLLIQ